MTSTARRYAIALSIIFFLSGAASLLLETLWFRLCGLVFGNSAWASAIVLGAFMAGLALGNLLSTRFGVRSPLRIYAILELTIAISGFLLVLVLPFFPQMLAPLFRHFIDSPMLNATRLFFAFVLLLIPSTVMGATLPTMVSALSARDSNFGRVLGLLYGCNTIGAVAGALIGELFLIRVLGIRGTGIVAALLSAVAAFAALECGSLLPPSDNEEPRRRQAAAVQVMPLRFLGASFLSGFCLLALEVIWFRFVILFVMSTTVSFAVMLAVVLAGIGLGALAASSILGQHPDADRYASAVAAGAVIAVILSYAGFSPHPQGFRLFAVVVDSLRLMLPVSILSGFLFTAIGRAVERETGDGMRAAAMTTFANTAGAALGPLAAGFFMLPKIGVERSFFVIALLYAAVGVLTWVTNRAMAVTGVVALLALVFFPFGLFVNDFLPFAIRAFSDTKVVAVKEGPTETAAYLETEFAGKPYMYRLYTNGYSMSATSFASKRYMSAFVYLPLALRPQAKSALLISYGVGITAKTLTNAKQLESIDIVDISRNILQLSYLAWPGTTNPLEDRRVRAHIEDGRFFLLGTNRTFDLITAEPPPPKGAGIVNLYTREHFTLIRDRLNDGGIASYWLPAYQMSESDNKGIVRAFCDVFPDCSLWAGSGAEWILLGTRGRTPVPTMEEFSRQWNDPVSGENLRRVGFESPAQMGATFVADAPMLGALAGRTPPVTDNFPLRLSPDPIWGMPSFVTPMIDGAPRAFAQSAFVRRTLPPEVIAGAARYFWAERIIDRILLVPFGAPSPPANLLRSLLTGTDLRTAPRLLFGDDAWLEDIARRARARGDRDPRLAYVLAVGELSDRHYAAAEVLFTEALKGMPNSVELRDYKALAASLQR